MVVWVICPTHWKSQHSKVQFQIFLIFKTSPRAFTSVPTSGVWTNFFICSRNRQLFQISNIVGEIDVNYASITRQTAVEYTVVKGRMYSPQNNNVKWMHIPGTRNSANPGVLKGISLAKHTDMWWWWCWPLWCTWKWSYSKRKEGRYQCLSGQLTPALRDTISFIPLKGNI